MQKIKSNLIGWIETSHLCLSFNKVSWGKSLDQPLFHLWTTQILQQILHWMLGAVDGATTGEICIIITLQDMGAQPTMWLLHVYYHGSC